MKHSQRHIPFLTLSFAVAATVVALYAYMSYATADSVRQADLARYAVGTEGTDQSETKSLLELASSTGSSRAELPSFFVPADDVVAFITALESLGPQSGSSVSIASIDADSLSGSPAGSIGAARAHIVAIGSWQSVMRALALAERMQYAVSVNGVRLDASSAGPAPSARGISHSTYRRPSSRVPRVDINSSYEESIIHITQVPFRRSEPAQAEALLARDRQRPVRRLGRHHIVVGSHRRRVDSRGRVRVRGRDKGAVIASAGSGHGERGRAFRRAGPEPHHERI